MNTRPSLLTIAEDCGTSVAVTQSGKYSHVQVIISHAPTRVVLSPSDVLASLMNATSDAPRQTIGQNPPASVSQIVPLNLKYWPMPTPKMHAMIPNTAAIIMASRRFDELSILCPSEEMREVAQIRYIPPSYPTFTTRCRPTRIISLEAVTSRRNI
jgi:hypothetical protein